MFANKKILAAGILVLGIIVGAALWAQSASRSVTSANRAEIVEDDQQVMELIARRNQVKGQLIPRYQTSR